MGNCLYTHDNYFDVYFLNCEATRSNTIASECVRSPLRQYMCINHRIYDTARCHKWRSRTSNFTHRLRFPLASFTSSCWRLSRLHNALWESPIVTLVRKKYLTHYLSIHVYIRGWSYTKHPLHNERDGVSNHQPHDCLHDRLFRRR